MDLSVATGTASLFWVGDYGDWMEVDERGNGERDKH